MFQTFIIKKWYCEIHMSDNEFVVVIVIVTERNLIDHPGSYLLFLYIYLQTQSKQYTCSLATCACTDYSCTRPTSETVVADVNSINYIIIITHTVRFTDVIQTG